MGKMMAFPKCQICKEREAVYAMQDLPGNDKLSFYFLGEHIRGFKVIKVCIECMEARRDGMGT